MEPVLSESSHTASVVHTLFYAVLGLTGILVCFFGYRLFKLSLTLIFGFLCALVGAAAGFQYGSEPIVWAAVGFFAGGIVGALSGYLFYALSVGIVGGLLGCSLLMPWMAAWDVWLQLLALFAVSLGCGMISILISNSMIRVATAIMGALGATSAIWYMWGGPALHRVYGTENGFYWLFWHNPWLMASVAALALLGGLFQFSRDSAD